MNKLASGVLLLLLFQVSRTARTAAENSIPIRDVRFDGPYQQIANSLGDEWAPTWGRDDVLYTANDDGSSFGGLAANTIAFGQLEGPSATHLTGTVISGMENYREHGGPLAWVDLESVKIDGVQYRFSNDCRLAESRDDGRTWNVLGKSDGFRCNSHFMRPGVSLIDMLGIQEASYVYAAFPDSKAAGSAVFGRVLRSKLALGRAGDWTYFGDQWGSLSQALSDTQDHLAPDGMNWKATNTYSVDGVLYLFITRCQYPWESTDPKLRHVWQNASIIKSTDHGRTWTPSASKDYVRPMFLGKRFGTPYFVWYGKDGAADVDGGDRYVYAVSNDGFFENGDNYILGRVLRSRLPSLSGGDWTFYKGGTQGANLSTLVASGRRDSNWTSSAEQATPILVNPGKSGMTGMTYIPGLRRYVMVLWHYHSSNFMQAIKERDLGTVLEFFEAPRPWGPWTKVKAFDTGKLGWYAPIIGQRFQTQLGSNSVQAYLYATGFTARALGGLDYTLYKFNYMPITLSTKPIVPNSPTFVGAH